jgi:hypothetical protein
MSLRRTTFFVLALLFTAATTSAASACCDWGFQAPVTYTYAPTTYASAGWGGCGGCGTPTAAVVYAQPVAPTPPPVAVTAWSWGTHWGCCHRSFVYAATPAVELMPVAPAPIYVVNQGPDYSGPGIMVPYHTWTPASSYVVPGSYPYFHGYHRWGYRYGWHRPFAPRLRVSYGARFYGHPFYRRPAFGPAARHFYR